MRDNLISGLITEEFSLNQIYSMDPSDYFLEEVDIESIYEDAAKPVQKKNVIERIIGVIQKIGKWIIKAVNSVIGFVTNLFSKKPLTADQVLKKLGVKDNGSTNDINLEIPGSDESEINMQQNYHSVAKAMDIEMGKEGELIITPKKALWAQILRHRQGKIKNKNGLFIAAVGNHVLVFNAIKNPECMQLMTDIATAIGSGNSLNSDTSSAMRKLEQILTKDDGINSYRLTMSEFRAFNNSFAKCIDAISGVADNVEIGPRDSVITLNKFSGIIAGLQFGINVITSCMKNVYTVDRSYVETISDTDTLSQFVGELINANIPGKYVAMNTWLVSTKEIKGDADAFKPIWGQTRVAFFPPNKNIVHKVSYNPYGTMSNKTEANVSKAIISGGDGNMIAKVEHITNNGVVIDVEKVKGRKPNLKELDAFTKAFADVCKKYNIVINDLHQNNVVVTPDGMKAIDYGMIERHNFRNAY